MNGAELALRTAQSAGVNVCFANPGTTEIPFVTALDNVPETRGILCLFEGVATGAADGYARMAGKPALTLVHLGPGFGNGVANLHNARRARTPLVNVIGDHASWHLDADAPLNMDVVSLAGTVSGWTRRTQCADDAGQDMADAVSAAVKGQVATLIFPHDYQGSETGNLPLQVPPASFAPVDPESIETAARLLSSDKRTALLLGGGALLADSLKIVERIRTACGCALYSEGFAGRVDRGAGLPIAPRVPYLPEDGLAALGKYDAFVFVDARRPVAFFGWPGSPSYYITDEQEMHTIGGDGQDALAVLTALADALGAPASVPSSNPEVIRPELPTGELTAQAIGATLAALQPENAIVMNSGITASWAYAGLSGSAPPHTHLGITGGAIGQGIPCATGAAVACPDRAVINLQADGSAAYTIQGLWTQAREQLNVTTLLCSNRRYKILQGELTRAGVEPGPTARSLTDLANPDIGWAQIARGMGVPAVTVESAEEMAKELQRGLTEPGPHFVELLMAD
jgi:acetolactate synthase I/II/III large subunit